MANRDFNIINKQNNSYYTKPEYERVMAPKEIAKTKLEQKQEILKSAKGRQEIAFNEKYEQKTKEYANKYLDDFKEITNKKNSLYQTNYERFLSRPKNKLETFFECLKL